MIKDKRLRLYSIFKGNEVGIVVLVHTLKAYFEYHSDKIRMAEFLNVFGYSDNGQTWVTWDRRSE
jgi:hypothetical protein